MKLIVGLGNPGKEYENTRHNVGFLVVDELQKIKKDVFTDFLIKKSDAFMNDSGSFVKKLTSAYHLVPSALFVVHDDLDILLGSYKIQFGKGPKDHNGLKSVDEALGTSDYWHVRVGIDNRQFSNLKIQNSKRMHHYVGKISGEEYVLQNFSDEEKVVLNKVIKEVCKKLATL